MKAEQNPSELRSFKEAQKLKEVSRRDSKYLFVWHPLLKGAARSVMVMPSPHGEFKSGISYNDAFAAGEIYANSYELRNLNVAIPGHLGRDICENLILIGGNKCNPIAKEFQAVKQASLNFYLDDGVIYDREKQIVVTPEYVRGQPRNLASVVADYGLVIYSDNPFGKATKILQLAGIKGFGTLAATIAVVCPGPVHQIKRLLERFMSDSGVSRLKKHTVEILVKICVENGSVRRDTLQIEKIRVSNESTAQTWESETYSQLKNVVPHRIYVNVTDAASKSLNITVGIDEREANYFSKSADRLKAIYFLAKQARDDYLTQSENKGWLSALELAEKLWQFRHRNGVIDIPSEIKRQMSEIIKRWAGHLQRNGELILSNNIKLDHEYINSEVLVFDLDIKKRIVDLVHQINHEEKNHFGPEFRLIESKPSLGYRINLHPSLIFITEAKCFFN